MILFTHYGWVTHICVRKLTIIGSDNGLSLYIIWTCWINAGILQTPWKLFDSYRTEEGVWPDFKHDYIQEFYESYSFFISKCPWTGKFHSVILLIRTLSFVTRFTEIFFSHLHSRKCIWKCGLRKGDNFPRLHFQCVRQSCSSCTGPFQVNTILGKEVHSSVWYKTKFGSQN